MLFTRGCIQNSVSIKCRLQTADCRLQIGYKMQTRYKMQTADCRLGIKCRLRPKLGINCRLRAKLSFRAVGDIFSSLTHPCRVIAFPSSFPRNFLSICTDCEQSMLCADQFETSTSPPPGKPRAFELLKIELFKFPPPWTKIAFKYPTLALDLTVKSPS